ncbi:MAG: ADP-ribosylglycohydrolase family protein, partial [Actinobacteria bacterium]|nr:ADP-ribosylglycohydrolase family protein [Actinomycetota bacterium]
SRVNFAVTIMALLYGESDLIETLNIAGLAGWDADNNMTTAAGLLGVIIGFEGLPESVKNSTDVYFNQDLIGGDLPEFDSVANIADRTRKLGELVIRSAGGTVADSGLVLPLQIP